MKFEHWRSYNYTDDMEIGQLYYWLSFELGFLQPRLSATFD